MTRIALSLLAGLLGASGAAAQSLNGRYVYQSPQGPVNLVLRHEGTAVTGIMTGADGRESRLNGNYDGRRAIGTIEIGGASAWFAAGFLEGGLTLLVAEVDPSTGEPNLNDGWRLDFTRAGSLQAAARPGGGAEASSGSPLVQQWLARLRGRKVTYTESYSSNDMAGGYSRRWEAFLCSDMSFHYRSTSTGMGGSQEAFSGRWRVVETGGRAVLQYQPQSLAGSDQGQYVVLSDRGGQTYFDGERVYLTNDNNACG